MIDPVKLAKDNGLWPTIEPFQPKDDNPEEGRTEWRDKTRATVKKLVKDYAAWAQSDKGVIDDPGPAPEPIQMPMEPPQPSESEEKHKEFRRVTDQWFDTEYMTRYLPEAEVWSVANALWQQKLDEARIKALDRRHQTLRMTRFLSYLLGGAVACFAVVALVSLVLPGYASAAVGGLAAVLAVFAVDFGFNKLEYKLAREKTEAETRREREREVKARVERQRLLQRLGLPDDTGNAA